MPVLAPGPGLGADVSKCIVDIQTGESVNTQIPPEAFLFMKCF